MGRCGGAVVVWQRLVVDERGGDDGDDDGCGGMMKVVVVWRGGGEGWCMAWWWWRRRAEAPNSLQVKMDDPNITMEEYIRLEKEKARKHGKVFNWETANYGKIWYDEDALGPRPVETEFPAIVFNDSLTSNETLSCEPTVSSLNKEIDFRISFDESDDEDYTVVFDKNSSQHIDGFNLKDEKSLSECDEEEQNVLYFNDLFSFNLIYPDDSKLDEDNDDDKIDIEHSSGDLSVKPLPNVINVDNGAYAHGSNKLLETSHDTSNKFFKTRTFIKELNFNIMTWNHLNKGMSFIFLIKNSYVPFGIPFDTKLFYKDGINLRQV
ncbi:hypothetical protein Tco_0206419 [Tanacetum coccineum]